MIEQIYSPERVESLPENALLEWIDLYKVPELAYSSTINSVSKGFILNLLIEKKLRRDELFLRHSDVYYMITRSPHDNV